MKNYFITLDFSGCEVIENKLWNQGEELNIGLDYEISEDRTLSAKIFGTKSELKYFYEDVYFDGEEDFNTLDIKEV